MRRWLSRVGSALWSAYWAFQGEWYESAHTNCPPPLPHTPYRERQ